MYRPSPQVPKPSPRAARICYESAEFIINLSSKQMDISPVDITWVFLLTVNMALNTLLWTVSYPEVRREHSRQDVEKLVDIALDVLGRSEERWPGTDAASQLYAIFSKACLQSYETRQYPGPQAVNFFTSPPAFADPSSPPEAYAQAPNAQMPYLNPPQFGYVFDSPPESMNTYAMDPNFPPPPPSFRSNSIFFNPASMEPSGRRFSYFPPDFMQTIDSPMDDSTPPATTTPEQHLASPPTQMSDQLPTPPDSIPTGNMSTPTPRNTLSPPGTLAQHTPNMAHTSPIPAPALSVAQALSPALKPPPPPHRVPTFAVPPVTQPAPAQRPLPAPTNITDWFSPPPPFISPYAFGNMSTSIFNDSMTNPGGFTDMAALGLQNPGMGTTFRPQFDYNQGRQGSLTQSQQLELMNVLETEGVGDIDAFLNGSTLPSSRWY